MDNKLTNEDFKNISLLLNRIDLKGSEALGVATLMQKVASLIKEEPVKEEEQKDKEQEDKKK